MKENLKKWLMRHKYAISSIAMSVATVAVYGCRCKFYQPREPEGLEEFCKRKRN
ncbi:MAG: cyclic lactone autoinducer peptide [Clostridium sp.]|nr:cyclic lactone autoinducer peptide [Clostridium sp.]